MLLLQWIIIIRKRWQVCALVTGENEVRGIIHHQLYKNNQINFNKDKMPSSSDEDDEDMPGLLSNSESSSSSDSESNFSSDSEDSDSDESTSDKEEAPT